MTNYKNQTDPWKLAFYFALFIGIFYIPLGLNYLLRDLSVSFYYSISTLLLGVLLIILSLYLRKQNKIALKIIISIWSLTILWSIINFIQELSIINFLPIVVKFIILLMFLGPTESTQKKLKEIEKTK